MRKTFWVSHDEGWYFRICGYGLSWDTSTYVSFSERMGICKPLQVRIGRVRIRWLKRSELPRADVCKCPLEYQIACHESGGMPSYCRVRLSGTPGVKHEG